jgi:polyhydroxyalkanoate synthase
MVNRQPFPVGEKLACTPGAVVYRDEIFELLQYAPATPAVRTRPLLMVPPGAEPLLHPRPRARAQPGGVPRAERHPAVHDRLAEPAARARAWALGIDDYLSAQARAAEVVKKITGSDTVNWLGLCAGGITTALMLGYLAATGDASPARRRSS